MIEFSYAPVKKIIIYQIEKHSLDDFLRLMITPETQKLGWGNGYYFFIHFFPFDNQGIIDDSMKGTQHFASVDYAEASFKSILKHPDLPFKVIAIDQSTNPIVKELFVFLKEREKKINEKNPL